jgi:hypothetical protein
MEIVIKGVGVILLIVFVVWLVGLSGLVPWLVEQITEVERQVH